MGFALDRRRFLRWTTGTATGALVWVACRASDGASDAAPAEAPSAVDGASAGEAHDSLALQVHRATRNTLLGAIGESLWPGGSPPGRAKPYPGRERVALPVPPPHERGGEPDAASVVRGFAPAPAFAASEITLEELARLLHLAYGVTGYGYGIRLRAAPSAGALYAGEVYVVAERVTGLAPGVYSYHAPSHALVRLRSGARGDTVAAALEHPGAVAPAPVAVLLTNVFHRYTHRYRNRGYRYALIDSGHIGENLRLAAAAGGLGVATPLRFHDAALNALLAVDGREEAVCALHAVGKAAEARPAARARTLVEAGPPAAHGEAGAPRRYHAATKLVPIAPETAGPARGPEPPASRRGVEAPEGPATALPEPARPSAGVAWSIRERRSARRFTEKPVTLPQLAALLEMARGSEAAALSPHVGLRLVVHRVAGLPPGTYHHDARRARLVRLRAGDQREALYRACLRADKARSAAVAFAMLADLEAAAERGDRAYRDLLLEAGAIGQRLYVGAESLGLAARNLAAFLDDPLNALLGIGNGRRAVVHLTMAGHGD